MAITPVQSWEFQDGLNQSSHTYTISGATAGNRLVLSLVTRVSRTVPTDPTGWHREGEVQSALADPGTVMVFSRVASGDSNDNFAITFSGNATVAAVVEEYSGMNATDAAIGEDVYEAHNANVTTSMTTGTVTPSTADGAFLFTSGVKTAPQWDGESETVTNYTLRAYHDQTALNSNYPAVWLFDHIITGSSAETATFSTSNPISGDGVSLILVYIPPAVGGGTTHEGSVSFSNSLAASLAKNAIFQTSCSFDLDQGISDQGNGIFNLITSFANQLGNIYQGGVDVNTALSLSNTLGDVIDSTISIEANVDFSTVQQILKTVSAIFEASSTFISSQGVAEGNNASFYTSNVFGTTQGVSLTGNLILDSSISFGIVDGFSADGSITINQVDANISYGLVSGYQSTNSQNILTSALNVGSVQSIQNITVANLFAASTFGSNLALTTNSSNLIEAAIIYAIDHSEVAIADISIEGTINLGVYQSHLNTVQGDLQGAVTLSHQAALQSITQAVLNSGLSLSNIQNISVNGSLLSLTLSLPCGRTLVVKVENRTLIIEPENRTTTIDGCN